MTCPDCQAEHAHPVAHCPRCGASLAAATHGAWDAEGELIEGTIVEYAAAEDVLPPHRLDASRDGEPPICAQAPTPSTSLVVARHAALPSLPVRPWRQPAVRAVARASAGALALSLGMRLLRGALARPRATSELASSALPVLRQLFDHAPDHRLPFGAASEQDADIVETFIYMRRIVRRR